MFVIQILTVLESSKYRTFTAAILFLPFKIGLSKNSCNHGVINSLSCFNLLESNFGEAESRLEIRLRGEYQSFVT